MSQKIDWGKTIQEKATVLWDVANSLSGLYKPHEYGLVILPMAIVKRFHDCLLPTHAKVQKVFAEKKHLQVREGFLKAASGFNFYNTSRFTFETLLADPKNIAANFRDYLNGFSVNVRDVLRQMEFEKEVATMEKGGVLYQVISDFNSAKADMSPDKVGTNDMGYIFENLVARFSESYDEQAGAHFTSRDIIYLMCDLLTAFGTGAAGASKTVYDMTMGTSQMLTCMEDRLREIDPSIEVTNFGQELNPFTFGIAKADMLIRGGNPDNMRYGNTLSDDKFKDFKFDYCISNPPFGIDWKVESEAVEAEAAEGEVLFVTEPNWFNYLADNPRRLALKLLYPGLFRNVRELAVRVSGAPSSALADSVGEHDTPEHVTLAHFSALGNLFLLDRPLAQVQVSRRDFGYKREPKPDGGFKICRDEKGEPNVDFATPLYAEKREALFAAAKHGAVLLSPCVSDGERQIAREALAAGLKLITLKNKGFSPLQKPAGRAFDACVEGRLLMLAPAAWPHVPGEKVMTRFDAVAMNRLCQWIAGPGAAEINYHGMKPANIDALACAAAKIEHASV